MTIQKSSVWLKWCEISLRLETFTIRNFYKIKKSRNYCISWTLILADDQIIYFFVLAFEQLKSKPFPTEFSGENSNKNECSLYSYKEKYRRTRFLPENRFSGFFFITVEQNKTKNSPRIVLWVLVRRTCVQNFRAKINCTRLGAPRSFIFFAQKS